MRRFIVLAAATVVVLVAWTVILGMGALDGWWRRPLAQRGDSAAFAAAADRLIKRESHGNVGFALIENGQALHERFASIGPPVDRDTLFPAASLSKWITALGVMSLVDTGRVDLDTPVETYLKRWRLPPSKFDNREVTVRRLLSHTAGLTDGLGYGGFKPGQPIQPLAESLTQAADASPGASGAVKVGLRPGSQWRYSGGGYALLQLMVEDVTSEPFDAYMRSAVLTPLGMTNSTFKAPETDAPRVAQVYDAAGRPAIDYRFSAPSAAGLYTSVGDLIHLIQAHQPGAAGAAPGRGVVKPATLAEMRRPQGYRYGVELWGLGVVLYAPNNAGGSIVGHDGQNDPAINAAARFDPASGDGIVVLETGNRLLASQIAGEWVLWRTGHVDTLEVAAGLKDTLTIMAAGWAGIIFLAAMAGWRLRGRHATARSKTGGTLSE